MEYWYFYFWDGVLVLLLLGWSTGTFTSGMEYWYFYFWDGALVLLLLGWSTGTCTTGIESMEATGIKDFQSL
ncbi:hypothetical protein BgiBS90_009292, partial [Biomphalaria glabrata]